MRRRIFALAVVCLFSALTAARGQSIFKVDEARTKAYFAAHRLRVDLASDDRTTRGDFAAKIKLEILDAEDCAVADGETVQAVKRGGGQTISSAMLDLPAGENEKSLLWYRLKYSVADSSTGERLAGGIVSLSQIMPELFELRAAAGDRVYAGMNYIVRVRAFHPVTNLPTTNVEIGGTVKLDIIGNKDKDKLVLTAAAKTGADGYAALSFKIPDGAKLGEDGKIEITGEKNGVRREASEDLNGFVERNSVYLNTDKPIYQPAQNFYARGLLLTENFATSNRGAAGEREIEFKIKDEDDTLLYRETAKTSRFGVASTAWKIPDDAKLGTYKILVEDEDGEEIGRREFKVSRYDLPNFTVAAKTDKTYYLPEDDAAEITVSAEYLFGKAVEKGMVKVVRETERRWNYDEQKYETEEEKPVVGETDADGKFTARVDLSEAHKELKDEEYERFEDLHFAAYFTDASSNRTEERRFDVRVSRDAVHVYLVAVDSYQDRSPKLPVAFYVSTYYADGAPAAACDVEISGKYEDQEENQTRVLTKLKTNALGAGRVEFAAPRRADATYVKDLQIKVSAADALGRTGKEEENLDIKGDAAGLQIRTAKAIYRGGEAIDAEIISTEADADAFVDVVKDLSVVASAFVHLKDGRASVRLPYNKNFQGEMTVAAYIDDEAKASRGVVYPHPLNLDLNARQTKTVYRPNEEARVRFNVKSAAGKKSGETALGVVVFDRAIEERARTDADFGGASNANQFGDYSRLLDDGLNGIDLSKPVSKDLQLAAELALADRNYYPEFFESDYSTDLKRTFANYLRWQFNPIEAALENRYKKDFAHPTDAEALRKILLESGIDFANMKDPWGVPYQAKVETEADEDALYIRSAGANKIAGDKDDFVVSALKFKYFTATGKAIDRAALDYQARTGKFIRDRAALRAELEKQGVDLDNLRDRFNRPYQITFGVERRFYTIELKSLGADGAPDKNYSGDDFSVWTSRADYFEDAENRIQTALTSYASATKSFPTDENQFKEILKKAGVDFGDLRDGWNGAPRVEFLISTRYADRVKTEVVGKYGADEKAVEKLSLTPVTQQVAVFSVKSAGADGRTQTGDDFNLATFSGVVAEQTKDDAKPVETKTETVFTGGKGAIQGTITDAAGAVIPNAAVTAKNEETEQIVDTVSNSEGIYLLKNLPSGKYTVEAAATGFQRYVVRNVPVRSSTVSELNFSMSVAGVSSSVDVTASSEVMNTTDSSVGTTVSNNFTLAAAAAGGAVVKEQTATPRLREYFPETLFWQPEILTDKNGRAEIKFKLADNLTTWKFYAVGSDAAGKIGVAAQEIKTFQPFFVDLEPPKNLTVGDRIGLPVSIRNYTDAAQNVSVSMAAGNWFAILNAANQTINVAPNKTENAVFDFRADAATGDGRQRVTATAKSDGDAIEKSIAVHPNGKEIVRTESRIFRDAARFNVDFPAAALPKTQTARVKIYPNLLAHVAEAVEGLLERPYGCGEQTISSTYPNLLILKTAKNSKNAVAPKLETQARKFLRAGYERLLGYQTADGGFSFWGARDASDAALTAYAIRFLSDASAFTDVDEAVISRARKWLLAQQRADGSWTKKYNRENTEDEARTKILTTYIARILAMPKARASASAQAKTDEDSATADRALRKAFDYLEARNAEIDEPFALASFALALFDAGDERKANAIVEKLEMTAKPEADGAYWNLETNTPFYGWGTAGRIETTALVVQALARSERQVQSQSAGDAAKTDENRKSKIEDLISKGTLFLLKNKDRYGVWYSTQATVNVLDAILAVVGNSKGEAGESAASRTAEIFVNNRKIKAVEMPAANLLAAPITVDLAGALFASNQNAVEVKFSRNESAATAQVVSNYYVAWQDFAANGRAANQSGQLRLDYDCDKKDAAIMQEINCRVEAERVGFRGYGMMLLEIGLPPGADVDRASLEKSKEENWSFSRYDVLPDRIIVYLWAQAGGTRVDFKFKPRFAAVAQTAPSVLYDYYNPEAQATIAPLRFSVR